MQTYTLAVIINTYVSKNIDITKNLDCRRKLKECMLKLSLEGFVSIYEKNTFRILAGPDTWELIRESKLLNCPLALRPKDPLVPKKIHILMYDHLETKVIFFRIISNLEILPVHSGNWQFLDPDT